MTSLALVRSLPSLAAGINDAYDAAQRAALSAVEHARRAGDLLIEAKAQLPHGAWLPWLAANCPAISARTAQNYMQLARADAQHVAHLTVREALALLAVPRERETGAPACGDEETVALSAVVAAGGWRYSDPVTAAASLRRCGQINPLLVRTAADGRMVLIDGRQRLAALRASGALTAKVRHVGEMSDAEATELQLGAELAFETDYAALASQVGRLVKQGAATPEALAAIGPFDAERIRHFVTLSTFDWSRFHSTAEPAVDDEIVKAAFRCPCCGHEWRGQPR